MLKNVRKSICLFAACSMVLGLSACGGSSDSAATEEKEVYELRLGTHYNTDHLGYAALERIAADLEETSEGRIHITLFPSNQLGDYTLTFEELSAGTVDMALIPIPSQYDSRLEMNFIPYLVEDYDSMETAFGKDSEFYSLYTGIMSDIDIKLLGIYTEGLIGFGFSDYPENYQDVDAAKDDILVRAPAIEVYNLVTQDLGYSATTIAYSDLYTSMQTGVCDGWIGGTPQLNWSDFRDVINYYVPYNVFVENIGFMMSETVFDGMPEDLQTMVEEAFMEESIYSFESAKAGDEKALQDMEDYGIEILPLTDAEIAAYKEHVIDVTWPKLESNIGADVLQSLIDANS